MWKVARLVCKILSPHEMQNQSVKNAKHEHWKMCEH